MDSPLRHSILIVDDEEDIRTVLQTRLELAGFDVRTASSGLDAIDSIRSDPPALVLLDLMLPDIDGFGICALVRRDRRYSRIPIILLTARAQPRDRANGAAVGADAFMSKPPDMNGLLHEVTRLIGDRA